MPLHHQQQSSCRAGAWRSRSVSVGKISLMWFWSKICGETNKHRRTQAQTSIGVKRCALQHTRTRTQAHSRKHTSTQAHVHTLYLFIVFLIAARGLQHSVKRRRRLKRVIGTWQVLQHEVHWVSIEKFHRCRRNVKKKQKTNNRINELPFWCTDFSYLMFVFFIFVILTFLISSFVRKGSTLTIIRL